MEEEIVPEQDLSLADTLQDYSEETRNIYSGGLSEDTGEDALSAEEI